MSSVLARLSLTALLQWSPDMHMRKVANTRVHIKIKVAKKKIMHLIITVSYNFINTVLFSFLMPTEVELGGKLCRRVVVSVSSGLQEIT